MTLDRVIEDFKDLTDVPHSYAGAAGMAAIVNVTTNGLEFGMPLADIFNEPTGFPNRTDSALSWEDVDPRTFRIAPTGTSYDVYQQGVRYTVSTTEEIEIADTSGTHAIYFDAGALSEIVNPTYSQFNVLILDKVLVALVYWNATDGAAYVVADERHGCNMSGRTHERVHNTIGTTYEDGLLVSDYVLDDDSDAGLTFKVSDGLISDDDLPHEIDDGDPANQYEQQLSGADAELPILYRDDIDGSWKEDAASTLPYKTGGTGRLAYNKDDGDGTFSQVEVTDGKWVSMTILGTNDWQYPLKAVQGQNEYADKKTAIADATSEILSWGTLLTPEIVVLYRFVMQTKDTYGGAKKAIIREAVDFRGAGLSGASAVAQSHLNLSNLELAAAGVTYGHIDDQAQTIAGDKTFSGVAVLADTSALASAAAPLADAQIANKKYVDDEVGGAITTHETTYNHANYDTAYSWGDHAGLYEAVNTAILKTFVDAKGDLISATGDDAPAILSIGGVDGHALVVDAASANGMKWAAVSAGAHNMASHTDDDTYNMLTSGTITTSGGLIYAGVDKTTVGTLYLYGADAGGSNPQGGEARFYSSATYEGDVDYWSIKAYNDDLEFKADGNHLMTMDGTGLGINFHTRPFSGVGDIGCDTITIATTKSLAFADGGIVDIIRDEDDMATDDVNALATQQSIKKYVDDNAGGGDVTAAANIDANAVVVGDDGAKGVKKADSSSITDAGIVTFAGQSAVGCDISDDDDITHSTEEIVEFDTELFDVQAEHNPATYTTTITEDGKYQISCLLRYAELMSDQKFADARVYINDVFTTFDRYYLSGSGLPIPKLSFSMELDANDEVEIRTYHVHPEPRKLDASFCKYSLVKLT